MLTIGALVIVLLVHGSGAVLAQQDTPLGSSAPAQGESRSQRERDLDTSAPPDRDTQWTQLKHAAGRLPVAAGLAFVLAMRPRRRGTPRRQATVVQTQIILAVVGGVVMLVVGTSLARAFGIVGAAGLVRYRAKVEDPKDAGVMLSTLAIGLAAGVGLWMLAAFATAFILALLWAVESFEPTMRQLFLLTVKAKDAAPLRPKVEDLLRRNQLSFALRAESAEELAYELRVPVDKKTDQLSSSILKLAEGVGVEWEEKKEKK
jgi:uncharacterized membrane protein YhiD involved in acid resistance